MSSPYFIYIFGSNRIKSISWNHSRNAYLLVEESNDNSLFRVTNPRDNFDLVFRQYLNCFEQDDPQLVEQVRENYISQPSEEPFNSDNHEDVVSDIFKDHGNGEYYQDEILDKLLFHGNVKNGFFIEVQYQYLIMSLKLQLLSVLPRLFVSFEYSNNWARIIEFVFAEFSNSEYYSNIRIIDPNTTNNSLVSLQ